MKYRSTGNMGSLLPSGPVLVSIMNKSAYTVNSAQFDIV